MYKRLILISVLIAASAIVLTSCNKDNDGQESSTFTDSRDGNVYKTVNIGNQVWMAENLKYLPSVVGPATMSETSPYYYVFGYDGTVTDNAKANTNYSTYGVLYNWPAAMNGASSSAFNPSRVQGVCPTGWHLPSDAEWTELTDYLGGTSLAGGKLKEKGTTHWKTPNTGATNESGFTALPGGYLSLSGTFDLIDEIVYWWSTTEYDYQGSAWSRSLGHDGGSFYRHGSGYKAGHFVRCLRD